MSRAELLVFPGETPRRGLDQTRLRCVPVLLVQKGCINMWTQQQAGASDHQPQGLTGLFRVQRVSGTHPSFPVEKGPARTTPPGTSSKARSPQSYSQPHPPQARWSSHFLEGHCSSASSPGSLPLSKDCVGPVCPCTHLQAGLGRLAGGAESSPGPACARWEGPAMQFGQRALRRLYFYILIISSFAAF